MPKASAGGHVVVSGLHCPLTPVIKRDRQDKVIVRAKEPLEYILEVLAVISRDLQDRRLKAKG